MDKDPFRKVVRELSPAEEASLERIREAASYLWGLIDTEALVFGNDHRAIALAKTKLEEAFDWAVRGVS